MKKFKILIRTAGGSAKGKQLGMGHIFRTMHLAKELKSYQIFFLLEDFGGAERILRKNGFKNIFPLKKNISNQQEFLRIQQTISKNFIDLIIFDKYQINKKFVSKITESIKTVIITDLKETQYNSTLLVNGFIGFTTRIKRNKFGTKCLLGPRYQILDGRFLARKRSSKIKNNLLISLGGFDEKKTIEILLNSISEYLNHFKVKVILGPATKKTKKIIQYEKKYPKNLRIVRETKDMSKEISFSSFGICGGGITSYEFAKLRVPFTIICQNPHQLITAREWSKKGLAINLGLVNSSMTKKIKELMKNLHKDKIHLNTGLRDLDGKGAQRVSKEIKFLLSQK